jgi:glycosyltransferase involved in cell wall biosynthesis
VTTPRVSIVIPNFNKAPFLGATIESIVPQLGVAEAIFVDDASTDGSLEVLQAAQAGHDLVQVIRMRRNVGGSACRNAGLAASKGDYVMFVDSDDLLAQDCCRNRLAAAETAPGHDLWVFPMAVFADRPERPIDRWLPRRADHLARFLAHDLPWHTMQPLWRSDFVRAIGGFDEAFPRLQDPEIHTKALIRGARVWIREVGDPDCLYRVTPDRHDSDATALAERHLAGTLRYCQVFGPQVPRDMRRLLTGTLIACQNVLIAWWRQERLSGRDLGRMQRELARACEPRIHRMALDAAYLIQRASPAHVPGIRRTLKLALRIP